ncbi:retrovirus-related pol polyprotein from transposon TNT 1-94 [Tanacetum coccineum]
MVVQIILWIVDSGCSKHMTGDRSLLKNFIEKFMGTVRFGNDNFAAITGYGDYIQGNITICHVYYVEGLGHNLFSVGQFCDGDLEVAFRSKTCYVRNLEGDDLLTGDRESNLYTISISDMATSSPVCLMSKATSTKSWLWHRRLSHLNFGTINDLTRLDLVDGLPKFKYGKDHLCSACERGKSKKASHPLKLILSDHSKLELLHMDLCGPMRVASINGKKYILVILDDYSRYTWVYFLHSKDETLEIIKKFIAQAQLNYKAKVCKIRTDNGTEFKNANIKAHYEKLGIMQQFSTAQTPQQNGVVERLNRTLVEVARTMLIFSRLPEFLWAEARLMSSIKKIMLILMAIHNLFQPEGFIDPEFLDHKEGIDFEESFVLVARLEASSSYNMGLWYPKDSGFELISYSDADHTGCKDDCKSTSGGLQFLAQVIMAGHQQLDNDTIIIMAQQQYAADVHPDELCPPNKRYDLIDANKKVDREHVQCPSESKILTNIIKNHPLRFSIAASSSVPWIYMAQFWHTLKEDGSKYRLRLNATHEEYEIKGEHYHRKYAEVLEKGYKQMSSTSKQSTVIIFDFLKRRSTPLTPQFPVYQLIKSRRDDLQDTLHSSLVEHKRVSRRSAEKLRKIEDLVNKHDGIRRD